MDDLWISELGSEGSVFVDNNEKLATHLFSSTDEMMWQDLRSRIPHQWIERDLDSDARRHQRLRGIETLQQRGLVVVDGHHLFLHSLRIAHENISTWNELSSEGGDRLVPGGSACPFDPVSARLVSYIAAQLIHRTLDVATQRAALSFADGMRIISSNHLDRLANGEIEEHVDPKEWIVLDNDWRIVTFDALLPDLDSAINDLRYYRPCAARSDTRLDSYLNMLDRGLIHFDLGHNRSYRSDYALKNEYIHDLGKSYFADSVFGSKSVHWHRGQNPYFQEKQVDVLLTMELCDAAVDDDLDWVCVITNDADYIPVLSRVRDSGKKVIWFCAEELSWRSKKLRNLFSSDAISVSDFFSSRPLFEVLFGLPALSSQSLTLPSGEEYSIAPWSNNLYELENEALMEEVQKDDERSTDN